MRGEKMRGKTETRSRDSNRRSRERLNSVVRGGGIRVPGAFRVPWDRQGAVRAAGMAIVPASIHWQALVPCTLAQS